ncbi:hypothetical protein BDZ89DRAFT_178711 [Hymenopellis radicata]|nr:hypothetical protein BDZ89DRAFT_178711 [Hymenopellis radicata]
MDQQTDRGYRQSSHNLGIYARRVGTERRIRGGVAGCHFSGKKASREASSAVSEGDRVDGGEYDELSGGWWHEADDDSRLCIDDVKDRMPRSLRSPLAGITITSWTDFRRAVDELNLEQLLFCRRRVSDSRVSRSGLLRLEHWRLCSGPYPPHIPYRAHFPPRFYKPHGIFQVYPHTNMFRLLILRRCFATMSSLR